MTLRLTALPAVVVGGALAATLAAAPAIAAGTAQHTTLTISTSTTGTSTVPQTITGKLMAGSTGVTGVVRLVGRFNGSTTFHTLAYRTTAKNGDVTFSVKPPKGHDQYALVYNGSHKTTPAYDGSHSRTVTVTVKQ